MKKFLALLLTGVMVVSMSVMVFAENEVPEETSVANEEVGEQSNDEISDEGEEKEDDVEGINDEVTTEDEEVALPAESGDDEKAAGDEDIIDEEITEDEETVLLTENGDDNTEKVADDDGVIDEATMEDEENALVAENGDDDTEGEPGNDNSQEETGAEPSDDDSKGTLTEDSENPDDSDKSDDGNNDGDNTGNPPGYTGNVDPYDAEFISYISKLENTPEVIEWLGKYLQANPGELVWISDMAPDDVWSAYTEEFGDPNDSDNESSGPNTSEEYLYNLNRILTGPSTNPAMRDEIIAGLPAEVWEAYVAKYGDPRKGSSESSSSSNSEEQYDRGSEAEALAVEAAGVSMTAYIGASTENKTIGEYMNNAVVAAPGLDNAIPVSQGGNVIINGVPSNQTFYVLKVLSGHTDSAKAHAASLGGKVLNVARINASVSFNTATVNFYMPGVKSGQNIQVYQYDYVSGQWRKVTVAEVRDDHVVVDMTSLGVLAFIEVPAAQ